jgi:hypothetical protein
MLCQEFCATMDRVRGTKKFKLEQSLDLDAAECLAFLKGAGLRQQFGSSGTANELRSYPCLKLRGKLMAHPVLEAPSSCFVEGIDVTIGNPLFLDQLNAVVQRALDVPGVFAVARGVHVVKDEWVRRGR